MTLPLRSLSVEQAARPFLRWPGGKGKAVSTILDAMPVGRVHAACVGGGAVEFALRAAGRQVVFADVNQGLMNAYRVVRDQPAELVAQLQEDARVYASAEEREALFFFTRDRYNAEPRLGVQAAADLIVLNRLCFNGLYRENGDGHFNVSMDPSKAGCDLVRAELLHACSRALQGQPIQHADFRESLARVQSGEVAWFDSPYWAAPDPAGGQGLFGPILKDSFVAYTAAGFSTQDHVDALDALYEVRRRGGWTLSTNAWEDGWVSRYRRRGFVAVPFEMARNVACTTEARAAVREVLFVGAPLR